MELSRNFLMELIADWCKECVDSDHDVNYWTTLYDDQSIGDSTFCNKVLQTIFWELSPIHNKGVFKYLHKDGGGEGGGEHVEFVFSYKDKFIKMEFAYFSFHGYDFDRLGAYFCEPREVSVIQYFPLT